MQKKYYSSRILLFLFTLLFFSNLSNASEESDFKAIEATAEQYVLNNIDKPLGGEITVKAASLDPRLKVGICATPLQVSSSNMTQNSNNVTVLVQCGEDDWKVYVPVRITVSMPLIAAARSLVKGEIITAADINSRLIELRQFRRYGFSAPEQVIGSKLKKNIKIGDILEQNDICVVCRNEKVMIKLEKGTLDITTKGTALSDGTLGEQIKVRNDKSQRILDGSVTGAGEVSISF